MSDPLLASMNAPPTLPNLRRARPAAAPAVEPESVEETAPEQGTAPRARRERPKPAPETETEPVRGGRPATGNETRGIGLPGPLADRVRDRADAEQLPLGEYLVAALDRQWDALDKVYPPLPERRPELPPARRVPRRRVPGGRQAVNFRLSPEQTAAIDVRQKQLGVASRSEFVTALLQLDLAELDPDGKKP